MRHDGWRRFAIVCGVVLACGACTPANKQIGSACTDGVCPDALVTDVTKPPVCAANAFVVTIGATKPADSVCVPRGPGWTSAEFGDQVECDLIWMLPENPVAGAPAHCSDLPFLTPTSDASLRSKSGPVELCLVDQRTKSSDEGWAYKDWFSVKKNLKPCDAAALTFTERAIPPEGVTVVYKCPSQLTSSTTSDVSPTDPTEVCKLPSDSARHADTVGDPCHVVSFGISQSDTAVSSPASECGTGVCLAYYVQTELSALCKAGDAGATGGCAQADDFEQDAFCSCRCDAPPGQPDTCACRDGFTCVPVFQDLPDTFNGSYCVRNDLL